MRPWGGLKPTVPQADDGMRIEPPISVPVARVVKPAASAAPAPPDEPPGPYSRFHGLWVVPQIRERGDGGQAKFGRGGAAKNDGASLFKPLDLWIGMVIYIICENK